MSDELLDLEFLECDLAENAYQKNRRLCTRNQCDPFHLSDMEFIRRYRLSKELVYEICEDLRPMVKEPTRTTDIDLEKKVTYLHYSLHSQISNLVFE
jgi:hypothetical protein